MGCDIHGPFIEQAAWYHNDGGTCDPDDPGAEAGWWRCVAALDWQRDYELFTVIADVRCPDGGIDWCGDRDHPAPKGLPWVSGGFPSPDDRVPDPNKMSWATWQHLYPYSEDAQDNVVNDGCHSHTTLSLADVVEAQAAYERMTGARSNDLAMAIGIMTLASLHKPRYELRLIACFDN